MEGGREEGRERERIRGVEKVGWCEMEGERDGEIGMEI